MEENTQTTQTEPKPEAKSKLNPVLIIGVVVIILVAAGYFIYGRGGYRAPAPATTQRDQQQVPPASQQDSEVNDITVEANEFSFSPSNISLTTGERVRITFKNVGRNPHNFMIDELGVASQTIPGGGSDTIEFTADKSGTFTFYCSIGNHRSLGMEGELSVE